MNKYAVLTSNEAGTRANFEAAGIPMESAVRIAAGSDRVDCAPVGRAERSFVSPGGAGLIWSIVGSSKNGGTR